VHLGPPVLDKVERSWSCWRHPNASGVGVNVACAMGNTRFSQARWDFLEGGSGRVTGQNADNVPLLPPECGVPFLHTTRFERLITFFMEV